jgi:DNA repair exonuclease SbcCD ATPase subunit
MIAAAALGFIIGWVFSSLLKNEKHEKQILAIKERFDEQTEQINLLETEMDAKDREIEILKKKYNTLQREMLSNEMDKTDESLFQAKISDLEAENLLLLEQIKEQKICEDENEILKLELKDLESEKQTLIDKIDELKEFEASYKKNIHRIAELESSQHKEEAPKTEEDLIPKNRKKSKKITSTQKEINDAICRDDKIIKDEDLASRGIDNDKLSQIIKNLFSNDKK